jgi:hypothetical protein
MKAKNLFILFLISSFASAASDSYITVKNMGMGLCLAADGLEPQVCDNETLAVDGTADHTLYIMPQSEIRYNSTMGDKASYIFLTPSNMAIGGVGFLLFFILFAYLIISLVSGVRLWRRR